MKKRIVICADGTWNRPEQNPKKNPKKDFSTNVLKLARAIQPIGDDQVPQQVWFAGAHSNIGGSYKPDKDCSLLSDNASSWMVDEAWDAGLAVEGRLEQGVNANPLATLHNSRRSFYRVKEKYLRSIDHGKGAVLIHQSVKDRWEQDGKYRPNNFQDYMGKKDGWASILVR